VWRRIKLVPFAVTIPDDEKDPDLPEKLQAEYPGILAWAVHGCLEWQQHGLGEPEEVRQATATYQEESDTLGQFIDECCNQHPEARVKASLLFEEYLKWSGDRFISPEKFGRRMREKGFEAGRSHGGRYYHGIMLEAENQGSGAGWCR